MKKGKAAYIHRYIPCTHFHRRNPHNAYSYDPSQPPQPQTKQKQQQKLNFGAHGYGSNFTLSVFDREWKEGLTLEEATAVMKHAIHELKVRFLISQPNWVLKVVDKDGVRTLPAPI